MERDQLVMEACVCSADGGQCIRQRVAGSPSQPAELGEQLAKLLFENGAQAILQEVSRARG
jgi:porphobilinogen deaminase